MASLVDSVQGVGAMIGLFLALITLFTNEQSRLRDVEHDREGGADNDAVRRIRWLTGALLLVTAVTWLVLLPTVVEIARLGFGWPPEPVLTVFVVIWLLLLGLAAWQVTIISR